MKILNIIKNWWQSYKKTRRQREIKRRLTEVERSIQLSASNGKVYIEHNGTGVRELDSNLTLAQALQILNSMREDASTYIKHEENLF